MQPRKLLIRSWAAPLWLLRASRSRRRVIPLSFKFLLRSTVWSRGRYCFRKRVEAGPHIPNILNAVYPRTNESHNAKLQLRAKRPLMAQQSQHAKPNRNTSRQCGGVQGTLAHRNPPVLPRHGKVPVKSLVTLQQFELGVRMYPGSIMQNFSAWPRFIPTPSAI